VEGQVNSFISERRIKLLTLAPDFLESTHWWILTKEKSEALSLVTPARNYTISGGVKIVRN
jgi:hypothetical protein